MTNQSKCVFLITGSPEFEEKFIADIFSQYISPYPVYAIDKGLEICDALQIPVQKIIGDLDSVDHSILEKYHNSLIQKFPPEKDASDTELAIDLAWEAGFQNIIILNAQGGRMDHFLLNALLLFKYPEHLKLLSNTGILWALPPSRNHETVHLQIPLPSNTLFSLIPIGFCENVTLSGAKYPLSNQTLQFSSLTLSNLTTEIEGNDQNSKNERTLNLTYENAHLLFFTPAWKGFLKSL